MTDSEKLAALILLVKEQGADFDHMVKSCEDEAAVETANGNTEAAAVLRGKADAYDYSSQMCRDLLKPIGEF